MRKNLFFVLTGPSGAGKSTLIKGIKEKFDLAFSVSHTTRAPREGEIEGRDYYFVEESVFEKMLKRGEFIEWTEVYGNKYGTTKKEVERLLRGEKDIVLDLDLRGALRAKTVFKDAIVIFIGTKSFEDLKERLRKRGEKDIEKRISLAKEAIDLIANFDYLVINGELESSLREVESIFVSEHLRTRNINLSKYKEDFFK